MSENRRRRNNGAQNRQVKKAHTNNARRILLLVGLMSLVAVISIGGTIAWLTASTTPVTNTFTASDINITLAETTTDYKMVPGNTISKDPKVTVKANSEACWLFVKIEESTTPKLGDYITYEVATGWTALTGVDGVYYREVSASTSDTEFAVLKDNQVTVKNTVTKAMMNELDKEGATKPTLKFTAYACQKDNIADATTAWAKLNPPSGT